MPARYPARYRDARGSDATIIENDGSRLTMALRGVRFAGHSLDDWEALPPVDPARLAAFTVAGRDLCAYTLALTMPLAAMQDDRPATAWLEVESELGPPEGAQAIAWQRLTLALRLGEARYEAPPNGGWFDDGLLALYPQLPADSWLRCCHTCAWSDYHPGGNGLFGDLLCFRNHKAAYAAVRDKYDLLPLLDAPAGIVQESYLCPDYARRPPHTGYRG